MTQRETVARLLDEHSSTYADDAGITLRDKPSPLYQLLVLTTLASTRISADIAAKAARELFSAGWRTPQRMKDATWQQRVDALGRGGYRRYDESTSTKLEESATYLLGELGGDLRRLRPGQEGSVSDLEQAIDRERVVVREAGPDHGVGRGRLPDDVPAHRPGRAVLLARGLPHRDRGCCVGGGRGEAEGDEEGGEEGERESPTRPEMKGHGGTLPDVGSGRKGP